MKAATESNGITLFFEGRIDSSNAPQIEAEVMDMLAQSKAESITIDAEELEYISSAGLRVIMKLAKIDRDIKIVNVTRDVYDILEMTGFTGIVSVERGLRRFSVEGCPVIGQGAVGTLYQYDPDTIVKVYRKDTTMETLIQERERSQLAFIHGVPSRIFYDIVKVGDCYGVIYEMIESSSMGRQILNHPELAEEYAVKFGSILQQIHAVDASEFKLPSAKDTYLLAAENLSANYTAEENQLIRDMIQAMPTGTNLIHGDFHPKNIMIQDGEPLLIDMGDICIGHPLYDIATAFFVILWLPPELSLKRSGIDRSIAEKFLDTFMRTYFPTADEKQLDALKHAAYCAGMVRASIVYGISNTFPQDMIDERVSLLRECVFPKADDILKTLQSAGDLFHALGL